MMNQNEPDFHDKSIIVLTKGYIALIDEEDWEMLSQWRWHAHRANGGIYARNGEKMYMHRLIMKTPRHLQTDHRDNNTLNNRKQNLRNCTRKTNCRNRKRRK
jgi:hypothetical protein